MSDIIAPINASRDYEGTLGRIQYVEPNNIYGCIGNSVMTPDYTDMNIYCNLIVEPTSRLKNKLLGDDATGAYSIAFDLNKNEGVYYTSFFAGADDHVMDDKGNKKYVYNYLTTDYSDIHFNSIKEKAFVEGLQIKSIDISYTNRMAPTVVINMTDIRGSGLFAREEYIHQNGDIGGLQCDKNGEYLDNIYSGFMTFPYPRYKLQIKGYYGRAVTYQLTCSNFIGKFDSQTGNFDITATFIGYEYGCLQDLPLSYVIAAPYTKVGRAYWNKMKYTDEWNLFFKSHDGETIKREPPILLNKFLKSIKNSIDTNEGNVGLNDTIEDDSMVEVQNSYNERQGIVSSIENAYNALLSELKKSNEGYARFIQINDNYADGDSVIAIISKKETINLSRDAVNAYVRFCEHIIDYQNNFPGDGVSISMIPGNYVSNFDYKHAWRPGKVGINQLFKKDIDGKFYVLSNPGEVIIKQYHSTDGENELDDASVRIVEFNSNHTTTCNAQQSTTIYNNINGMFYQNTSEYAPYISLIVFKNYCRINSILSNLGDKINKYNTAYKNHELTPITSFTGGITPYIGNYFKMVFCHVDTFIHTMWQCADDIYSEIESGNRTPDKMGIFDMQTSDIPENILQSRTKNGNNGCVPPFPAIYHNRQSNGDVDINASVTSSSTKVIGWVGNIKGTTPWREQELIEQYYKVLLDMAEETIDNIPWESTDGVELVFNLLPCFIDMRHKTNLFATREGLAYYVTVMGSWIIGAINKGKISNDEAELIGGILAETLFDDCDYKDRLVTLAGDGLANEIPSIAKITDRTNNEAKRFEFALSTKDRRHSIIRENGDNVEYVYMRASDGSSLIPVDEVQDWKDLQKNYSFVNPGKNDDETASTFTPNTIIDGQYIIASDGDEFAENTLGGRDKFVNNKMFSVWSEPCNVANMEVAYNAYKDSGLDVGPYKQKNINEKILKKYWLMSDNYEKYFSDYKNLKTNKYKSIGIKFKDSDGKDCELHDLITLDENLADSKIDLSKNKELVKKIAELKY